MPVREAASISITSTWRSSVMPTQCSHTPQGSTVGPPLPSLPTQFSARAMIRALNCVGKDGKGGPTVDPCGVCEAAGGDGVAKRAHHRFLADQGGEIDGTVFAGEDSIGKRFLGFRHGSASYPERAVAPQGPAVVAPGPPGRRDSAREGNG